MLYSFYLLLGTFKITDMKIEVSQDWVIKILLEKLKSIDSKLIKADEITYSKKELSEDEIHNVWNEIRDSNLEIEELIGALE